MAATRLQCECKASTGSEGAPGPAGRGGRDWLVAEAGVGPLAGTTHAWHEPICHSIHCHYALWHAGDELDMPDMSRRTCPDVAGAWHSAVVL